eukprot:6463255-Amphidinium_carterae.1
MIVERSGPEEVAGRLLKSLWNSWLMVGQRVIPGLLPALAQFVSARGVLLLARSLGRSLRPLGKVRFAKVVVAPFATCT